MYSANAARNLDDALLADEEAGTGMPSSEQVRYAPRYRVVARRAPTPSRGRLLTPMQRTVLLAVVPTLCLLTYVLFWTLAMRGGFLRDKLQGQLKELQTQQSELQAEKRERQSPGPILHRAAEMGMRPGDRREFARMGQPSAPASRP